MKRMWLSHIRRMRARRRRREIEPIRGYTADVRGGVRRRMSEGRKWLRLLLLLLLLLRLRRVWVELNFFFEMTEPDADDR